MFTENRPIFTNTIVARNSAKVNAAECNRVTDSPELGRTPYSLDPGTQRWRRSEVPSTPSHDLWSGILENRNAESSLVTLGEMRELVGLIEPTLLLSEGRGVSSGPEDFWIARSWARVMSDPTLSTIYVRLATIKARLGRLLDARNLDAVNDHLWISALLADVDEEVQRRLRRQGNPLIGDGSSADALRNHIGRNRGRMNWIATSLHSSNAGSAVQC